MAPFCFVFIKTLKIMYYSIRLFPTVGMAALSPFPGTNFKTHIIMRKSRLVTKVPTLLCAKKVNGRGI